MNKLLLLPGFLLVSLFALKPMVAAEGDSDEAASMKARVEFGEAPRTDQSAVGVAPISANARTSGPANPIEKKVSSLKTTAVRAVKSQRGEVSRGMALLGAGVALAIAGVAVEFSGGLLVLVGLGMLILGAATALAGSQLLKMGR